MAKSYLSLTQRWRIYRAIPTERRDILDLWWALTGYC